MHEWLTLLVGALAPLADQPPPLAEVQRARAALRHQVEPCDDGTRLHRVRFPDGTEVTFSDHPRRPQDRAQRERTVSYVGTEAAGREPDSTFEAAGRNIRQSDLPGPG